MANDQENPREDKDKFKRSWDPFLVKPVEDEEEKTSRFILGLNMLICSIVGLLVFACGFLSKSSLLLLIIMTGEDSLSLSNKPFGVLIVGTMLVTPNVLTFLKSTWKVTFSHSLNPPKKDLLVVCLVEALVALGSSVLTVVAMPHFNIISNIMILNSVCIIPSIMQLISRSRKPTWKISVPIFSIVFFIIGYIMFFIGYINTNILNIHIYLIIALFATICISLNWCENFLSFFDKFKFSYIAQKSNSRDVLYMCSSIVRILVTAIVVGSYVPIIGEDWTKLKAVPHHEVTLVIMLFCIQAVASVVCHWFGVVACKMHSVRRSFALPLISTTVAVTIAVGSIFAVQYKEAGQIIPKPENVSITVFCNHIALDDRSTIIQKLLLEVTNSLCQIMAFQNFSNIIIISLSGLFWYLGFVLCTFYVWTLKVQRIERTTQLFVRRLYEAAFIDQSMLLNTRVKPKNIVPDGTQNRPKDKVMIYLCATMWHETFDEMLKILTSMFRLDRYKSQKNKDTFDFEAHIYFDDAYTEDSLDQDGRKTKCVNSYVECLVTVIEEVHRVFTSEKKELFSSNNISNNIPQKIMVTPYGGRLCYTLPHGNLLYVHLKDKQRIRHKKRWSQIMYLYYLLGYKLYRKYSKKVENLGDKHEVELSFELEKEKANTYILALDGDTDFQPSALMLLVDRLKMYPHVGAACGRIHPTGMGPMVWYQKFEYAVGHWLQKSSEHVFGCVLCSPGCFSLFRASALMDDNVLKKYSTTATEATQYVQYDQGEDRWLCTLLLQQGWRVEYNAASDAYTNAPQEFQEFYNQRRRWGPSTMANTIDLLHSGGQTAKRNTSISYPYVLYQTITMASSILSPATVCLMIAGAFSVLFHWSNNISLVIAIAPPALYIGVCYLAKPSTQLSIAAVLSVIYAFLMTATFLCIINGMVKDNTFVTPTGIFLISMGLIYVITALLHPQEFSLLIYGLLYIICVPSGYLLLTIYSLVNMHIVSWGTRETVKPAEKKEEVVKAAKYKNTCKCLCWDVEIQIHDKNSKVIKESEKALDKNVEAENIQSQENGQEIKQEVNCVYEETWIKQLQMKSSYNVLNEENLVEEEVPFWNGVIKHYLEPIAEDKKKQEEIVKDLKSLRDKVTFLFFMINLLWIVATFFLEIIGSTISLKLPKVYPNGTVSSTELLYVEPIGFMFLLSFGALLLLQFLGLLYHRIYTLIHFIAYQETEGRGKGNPSLPAKDCKLLKSMIKEADENVYENPHAIHLD
ncbi:chitin synthase chs-2-like [Discoglossus pictus]